MTITNHIYHLIKSLNRERLVQKYLKNGGYPWTPGYDLFKQQYIEQAFKNGEIIDKFREGSTLPAGYGIGIDERCVEYLWVIANLGDENELILDAGSVTNFDYIIDQLAIKNKILHIMTLAPEHNCFWTKGISYIYSDLRDTPMRDAYYDKIICVSTLEHIGFDNSIYTGKEVVEPEMGSTEDIIMAIKEMRRILKPGGCLMLTVPYGVYRNFGTFQQFDYKLASTIINTFGSASLTKLIFFKYTANGWNISTSDECADAQYVEWVAKHPLPKPTPTEKDKAAAARAVACIMLTKSNS